MEDGTKMFCMHEVSETCLAYNALSNLEPDGRQKTKFGTTRADEVYQFP